ncbi:regulator of chromosome condensation repeat-containing protein [Cystoisospora suis]|uniref:Regulator of chromosome condensation repeat-containing protein n=1 Tax=Cystoisospora suis TaxID=483139 RepID=A0A2C6KFY9_9APIC|nr:regulator of chromosome condensation repeat-containing protein [Cystoisospora suis]
MTTSEPGREKDSAVLTHPWALPDKPSCTVNSSECENASTNCVCLWRVEAIRHPDQQEQTARPSASLSTPFKFCSYLGILSVACGESLAAFIAVDGRLYCWDWSSAGGGIHSSSPQLVEGANIDKLAIKQVSCGSRHLACITENGRLFTYGLNESGQRGLPSDDLPFDTATEVLLPCPGTQVACGPRYTFVVTDDGRLYGMGDGSNGVLGNGSTKTMRIPTRVNFQDRRVSFVAAGVAHALAVTDLGSTYAWGRNNNGQLGLGHRDDRWTPQVVCELSGHKTLFVAAHEASVALTRDEKLFLWGSGSLTAPVMIFSRRFRDVALGDALFCLVDEAERTSLLVVSLSDLHVSSLPSHTSTTDALQTTQLAAARGVLLGVAAARKSVESGSPRDREAAGENWPDGLAQTDSVFPELSRVRPASVSPPKLFRGVLRQTSDDAAGSGFDGNRKRVTFSDRVTLVCVEEEGGDHRQAVMPLVKHPVTVVSLARKTFRRSSSASPPRVGVHSSSRAGQSRVRAGSTSPRGSPDTPSQPPRGSSPRQQIQPCLRATAAAVRKSTKAQRKQMSQCTGSLHNSSAGSLGNQRDSRAYTSLVTENVSARGSAERGKNQLHTPFVQLADKKAEELEETSAAALVSSEIQSLDNSKGHVRADAHCETLSQLQPYNGMPKGEDAHSGMVPDTQKTEESGCPGASDLSSPSAPETSCEVTVGPQPVRSQMASPPPRPAHAPGTASVTAISTAAREASVSPAGLSSCPNEVSPDLGAQWPVASHVSAPQPSPHASADAHPVPSVENEGGSGQHFTGPAAGTSSVAGHRDFPGLFLHHGQFRNRCGRGDPSSGLVEERRRPCGEYPVPVAYHGQLPYPERQFSSFYDAASRLSRLPGEPAGPAGISLPDVSMLPDGGSCMRLWELQQEHARTLLGGIGISRLFDVSDLATKHKEFLELRSALSLAREDILEAEKEKEGLRKELRDTRTSLKEANGALEKSLDYCETLDKTVAALRKKIKSLQDELDEEAQQHHKDLTQVLQKLKNAEQERGQIALSLASANASIHSLELLKGEEEKLEREAAALKRELLKQAEQQALLSREAEEAISEWRASHEKLQLALTEAQNKHSEETAVLKREVDRLTEQLREAEEEKETLREQRDGVSELTLQSERQRREAAEERADELEAAMNELAADFAASKRSGNRYKRQLDSVQEEKLKSIEENKGLHEEIARMRDNITRQEAATQELQEEAIKLRAALTAAETEDAQRLESNKRLEMQIAELSGELSRLQEENGHLEDQLHLLKQKDLSEGGSKEKTDEACDGSMTPLRSLREQNGKMAIQIEELQADLARHQAASRDQQVLLHQLQTELQSTKHQHAIEVSCIKEQKTSLEKALHAQETEKAELQIKWDSAKEHLNAVEKENGDAKIHERVIASEIDELLRILRRHSALLLRSVVHESSHGTPVEASGDAQPRASADRFSELTVFLEATSGSISNLSDAHEVCKRWNLSSVISDILQELRERIDDLTRREDDLKTQVADLTRERREYLRQIEDLNGKLHRSREDGERNDNELHASEQDGSWPATCFLEQQKYFELELGITKRQLTECRTEVHQLRTRNSALLLDLAKQEERIAKLVKQNERLTAASHSQCGPFVQDITTSTTSAFWSDQRSSSAEFPVKQSVLK